MRPDAEKKEECCWLVSTIQRISNKNWRGRFMRKFGVYEYDYDRTGHLFLNKEISLWIFELFLKFPALIGRVDYLEVMFWKCVWRFCKETEFEQFFERSRSDFRWIFNKFYSAFNFFKANLSAKQLCSY